MNILVTGAKGFVGKNLIVALYNIRDGKDRTRPNIKIDEIYEYDIDSKKSDLQRYCKAADFVFNLAGVNRPKDNAEFMQGNCDFVSELLAELKAASNTCPIMLSSSVQATLVGRYNSDYGRSKKAGEDLFFEYGKESGAKIVVYRFPNLFGKWCKPNYNSVVATFCYNIANGLAIHVNDESTELELLYIDDLVNALLDCLEDKESRCDYEELTVVPKKNGKYCYVPTVHRVTLGEIVNLLKSFNTMPNMLQMCEMPQGSFVKKLYSTFLSYLPKERVAFEPKMNIDERGSFTELLKTEKCGQFSVNITKPGVTKGQHWHHSKWELFIVVSGHGLIHERKIGGDEVLEFEVSGDKIQEVVMLPGYTHSITNLSETQDLVTLMWANEQFDPLHPDTFAENV